jgi:hypothetical protein
LNGRRKAMADEVKMENGLEPVTMRGGKRANIGHNGHSPEWNWWVGWGKDQSCQFEGPWQHLAILAAKILAHPNTQRVCPNLYRPESGLTPEQEDSY